MEYKGYTAEPIEFDDEVGVFHGRVAGLRDVVTFEGSDADELVQAFRESVDDYLAFCDEEGRSPERPYNGDVPVRVGPDLLRKAAMRAAAEGLTVNAWIAKQIEAA